MQIPPQITKALSMLEEAGYSAYIVGGCVRDHLRNVAPVDYDLTTSALPAQVEEVFSHTRIIETGLKHGTVTVIIEDMPVEITTFRKEGAYSDSRHPDSVTFTGSLEEDLKRRDFTINAIAYSKKRGMVDCFGGRADLQNRIIRAVGNADRRFKEDALRIMRALRFSSCLGFEIEDETKSAIFDNMALLKKISIERVRDELIKLLCGQNVRPVLMTYPQVIGQFIPEIMDMAGFDQHNPHHIYDLLEHTARVVENSPAVPYMRLAALLHDIGKPSTFTLDKNGIGHFYGHDKVGCQMSENILRRLKVDNSTRGKILTLIQCHDDRIECEERAVRRLLRKIGEELFFDLLSLKRADNKAQNITCYNHLDEYSRLEGLGRSIIKEGKCFSLSGLAISGDDLLALGYKGRAVGDGLRSLLDAVIDGRVENEKDKLIEFLSSTT